MRHSQSKVKKMLSEANIEMGHAVRRAEQYETEVKRLRSRVEELKKDLTYAEDELDSASSAVRRLQRTNEDLNARYNLTSCLNTRTNTLFILINGRCLLSFYYFPKKLTISTHLCLQLINSMSFINQLISLTPPVNAFVNL